jgi:hypothetical protein
VTSAKHHSWFNGERSMCRLLRGLSMSHSHTDGRQSCSTVTVHAALLKEKKMHLTDGTKCLSVWWLVRPSSFLGPKTCSFSCRHQFRQANAGIMF